MSQPRRIVTPHPAFGFTLVEAAVAMVIVAVMFVASLNTVGVSRITQHKAVLVCRGRMFAESLLAEIQQQAYQEPGTTYVFGRETGELATSRVAYDDVDDYNGWSESPPVAKDGAALPNSTDWRRTVTVEWVNPLDPQQVSATESRCQTHHVGGHLPECAPGDRGRRQGGQLREARATMLLRRPKMSHESRHRRRAGSIYLHVLASSLLITILGLGALAAVRIQMRSARLVRDAAEARACAVSAIELGLLQIKQNPNWRTERPNGTWFDNQTLGAGRFTLQGVDLADGSLSDSVYEPVVLTGIGTKGAARHKAQVTLVPVVKPLAALSSCVVASGNIVIAAGKQMTVIGAPVTTNANLGNSGTIDGNAEGQTANGPGTITGTLTVPGTVKPMPEASVFSSYVSKATVVPCAATIEKVVLAPGCNPLGTERSERTLRHRHRPAAISSSATAGSTGRSSSWPAITRSPSTMPCSWRPTAPISPSSWWKAT